MITSVCMNPSIDRTMELSGFSYGGMNRAQTVREDASGKGVNVAVALAQLGLESSVIGLFGKENQDVYEAVFEAHGVECPGLWREGATRTNVKLVNKTDGKATEINAPGEQTCAPQLDDFTSLAFSRAAQSDYMVLTGSLPPQCPADYYRFLIESLETPCVLDTEGESLKLALSAQPYLIKPNLRELAGLLGSAPQTQREIVRAALDLTPFDVHYAVISMGSKGAVLADGNSAYHAPGVHVPVSSSVGAGDCMVAGLLYGLTHYPEDSPMLLRCAMAAGTAGVMTRGTQPLRKADFESLLDKVTIEKL